MNTSEFVRFDSPASSLWGDWSLPESLLQTIAEKPDTLIRAGSSRPMKVSRESLIVELDWPAGNSMLAAAVKQYRPRSPWKTLAAIFRPAKAMLNWRKAAFLLAHDIATPRPLLACRSRHWRMSGTSFLATELIAGAENLHRYGWRIAAQSLDARLLAAARCARALGRLLGKLHAAGAAHRDLKAANLLVVEGPRETTVYLVDLDGLRVGAKVSFQQQARDLARLAAGLAAHPWVTKSICLQFIRAYLKEMPGEPADWKRLWRAIAEQAAVYSGRKQKRGERVL